jgi:hypothetical protein
MCPCWPRVEWACPKSGEAYAEAIVFHNAFDCREIVEEAERLSAPPLPRSFPKKSTK